MHDTDDDIAALDQVFGQAKADYHALRHAPPLRIERPEPRRRKVVPIAIAASVALAIGITGVIAWQSAQLPERAMPSTIASRSALPDVPIVRPDIASAQRPVLDVTRPTLSFALPERPGGSNG
ncbi:hypothetical protein [Hasllibacter sp. MH4015]|uniref:hypothetical protein n=1 Tax=Hasllibacter sp. MH4015 TaxID=2854029 RepID=UPI001CD43CE6|nr:hypothetical protein [Hasllibacter sp. MH4015]